MQARRLFCRLVVAAFVAIAAVSTFAATVAERSPFAQGLWWDSTRSGSGFDIFNHGDYVMVIWYTYDATGRPVWYSAEGSLASQPNAALDLLQHRWADGRRAGANRVGTLRLDVKHAERIDAIWTLGGVQGTWRLQPFTVSGTTPEVDHSGTWFEPQKSGWGLSLIEQGDVLGAVVYTYDATGAPTWISGFGRLRNSVEMFAFEGACPSCAYRAPAARGAGHLDFDFLQEGRLALRDRTGASMAAGIRLEGANLFQLGRPASTRAADRQLASFHDDGVLRAYLAAGLSTGNLGGFSAAPPPAAFSTTNLQETGVDEADVVKSDGRFIYTYAYENGIRRPALRIAETANGSSLRVLGTHALASGPATPMHSAGLFLDASTLVSIAGTRAGGYFAGGPGAMWSSPYAWTAGTTHVEVMSLANPASPATRWRAEIDGHVLSSRRIGNRAYVVLRFASLLPGGMTAASAPLAALLPKVRINGGEAAPLLDAASVYAPPQGERPPSADMVIVLAIDLAAPRIAQALAIVGTPETMYASTSHVYVATSRHLYRSPTAGLLPEPPVVLTDIHQIRLGTSQLSIVGSGTVEGFLGSLPEKAAFRMSEYRDQLRVVSSSYNMWNGTRNRLTVLAPSPAAPGLLRTVSTLPNAQRPQPLGKPGELLYATRFLEDRLYAVTFMKIDPLYVVDLSSSADPFIAGEVELPGFSEYLHPLPNGRLLGFGMDACPVNEAGDAQFAWYQGLQMALFDVSDARRPRVLQQLFFGKRGSTSALLSDHHAFSSLVQGDGMAIAIPARIHDGTSAGGCSSAYYPWKESGLLRFELRGSALTQKASLVTHAAGRTPDPGQDPAASDGRSILFGEGVIYIGHGQFWRQDNAGATTGPF